MGNGALSLLGNKMDKLEEAKNNGVAAASNAQNLQELDAVRSTF